MISLNYQTARGSNGTYHIYTGDESPYSIYLTRPLEHYLPSLKGTIKQGYRPLKAPKYLSDDEMVVGLKSVAQAFGDQPLHLMDLFILATHYPPGKTLDFYMSVQRYRNVYSDIFPRYEDVLHYLSVDNMVHLLRSTYDTNTTWGTAKGKLYTTSRPDFSRGFYKPEHVRLYDTADSSLDNIPTLLIVAWSELLNYRDNYRDVNLNIAACTQADLAKSLEYINNHPQARKVVLGYLFSGEELYDYVKYSNYHELVSLYRQIAEGIPGSVK